jgi:hypothetical protein
VGLLFVFAIPDSNKMGEKGRSISHTVCYIICYTMFARHYAVRNKAKLFRLFDQEKRPSDIADAPVSRRTLYQYYWEWRREKGIEGKKTGFAVKPFDRKTYLEAKKGEELKREKERLVRWVKDYEIVLSGLRQWVEDLREREATTPRIYLPIKGEYRWLSHLLRYKRGETGSVKGWRDRLPIILRSITWLERWIELARKASTLSEFKELCTSGKGGYPPEVENY